MIRDLAESWILGQKYDAFELSEKRKGSGFSHTAKEASGVTGEAASVKFGGFSGERAARQQPKQLTKEEEEAERKRLKREKKARKAEKREKKRVKRENPNMEMRGKIRKLGTRTTPTATKRADGDAFHRTTK